VKGMNRKFVEEYFGLFKDNPEIFFNMDKTSFSMNNCPELVVVQKERKYSEVVKISNE
jgi:hypothetical protein